jgi:putative transposase
MKRYFKETDEILLVEVKSVLDKRSTYGYKRVTAMINKDRVKKCLPKVNKKRIYRIMDINGLLLKSNSSPRVHQKTGEIITLHSNTRWSSDGFEIECFNGKKSTLLFP